MHVGIQIGRREGGRTVLEIRWLLVVRDVAHDFVKRLVLHTPRAQPLAQLKPSTYVE